MRAESTNTRGRTSSTKSNLLTTCHLTCFMVCPLKTNHQQCNRCTDSRCLDIRPGVVSRLACDRRLDLDRLHFEPVRNQHRSVRGRYAAGQVPFNHDAAPSQNNCGLRLDSRLPNLLPSALAAVETSRLGRAAAAAAAASCIRKFRFQLAGKKQRI